VLNDCVEIVEIVLIDGVEWTGVKFISGEFYGVVGWYSLSVVSPQWHSHVKTFPINTFPSVKVERNSTNTKA
jgi:hypothetical protein